MNNVDSIIHDLLGQLRLHSDLKARAFIMVYLAERNFQPVIEGFVNKASQVYQIPFKSLEHLDRFLREQLKHSVSFQLKPHHSNHLLLTTLGITAVILEYTE